MPIWEREEKKPVVTVPKTTVRQGGDIGLGSTPSVPSTPSTPNLAQLNRVETQVRQGGDIGLAPSVPKTTSTTTKVSVPSAPSSLTTSAKVTVPTSPGSSGGGGGSSKKKSSSKPRTPAATTTVTSAPATSGVSQAAPTEPGIPVSRIDPNYLLVQAKRQYAEAQARGDTAGMQAAAALGQQARAAGATIDPGNTLNYEQAAAAYNQQIQSLTGESADGGALNGFRKNLADLQDLTNKAIATSGGAEVAAHYLRYFENALAQAQGSITAAFQQQLGGMDATTQAALTQIRQEFDLLRRSWLEDFARRGLLQSGIAQQAFEERIAARQLTAEQQVIADQFRNILNQMNAALMQFAQMRLQTLTQFGLAGVQAAESAANRQQQAFGQALSGALQLSQQQLQQQQFARQQGLAEQQFAWQTQTQWPAQLALQQQQVGTAAAAQALEAQRFGWQRSQQSAQQVQALSDQAMQWARQMVELEMPRNAAGQVLNPMTPDQIEARVRQYYEYYMNQVGGSLALAQARAMGLTR